MSERFCPRCNAEVEDTGGYCLLGHSLRVSAPADSLAALRAEVDLAFEEARVQVAHALGDAAPPPPPPPVTATVPLYPRIEEAQAPSHGTDPITDFAPAPRMDWGPDRRQGLLKRFE